jgi:hypothetical protein
MPDDYDDQNQRGVIPLHLRFIRELISLVSKTVIWQHAEAQKEPNDFITIQGLAVSTTAAQVISFRPTRNNIIIQNTGIQALVLASSRANLTRSPFDLPGGASLSVKTRQAFWALTVVGTSTIDVCETLYSEELVGQDAA